MINIILHGVLGKKLGKNWQLNVDSIYEIFEAVEANNQKINKDGMEESSSEDSSQSK